MVTEVETIIVTTEEVVEAVDVVPVEEEEKPEAANPNTKTKTKKEPKPKKSSAPKKPASHPPYFVMIQEAITTLKDRTGSSQVAIVKFIEENQKNLPGNFRKLLLVQLKNLVAAEKLMKVKGSFKIPSGSSKPASPAKKKLESTATKKKAPSAKPNAKAVAKKPKVATPVKAKAVATKAKVATPVKAKAATRPKPKERVAKVAKMTTRATPGRKPPTARAPPAPKPVAAAKKKASVKRAAAKSPAKKAVAKSPAKKATTKRGGRK